MIMSITRTDVTREVITLSQTAVKLGITESQLRYRIRSKAIIEPFKIGSEHFFMRSEVDQLKKAQ